MGHIKVGFDKHGILRGFSYLRCLNCYTHDTWEKAPEEQVYVCSKCKCRVDISKAEVKVTFVDGGEEDGKTSEHH
jgi:hypothetical protein